MPMFNKTNMSIKLFHRKSLNNKGSATCLRQYNVINMPVSYVIDSTKRAKNIFAMFLTIFEYAEYNAEGFQAQLSMQRLEF